VKESNLNTHWGHKIGQRNATGRRASLATVQSVIAAALSLHIGLMSAATPSIGTIVAQGAFRVDQSLVNGNATLFEGSIVETNAVASSIQLGNRASFLLGAGSRGRLYGNRLVLEKGSSRLDKSSDFYYEAVGLTIHPKAGPRGEANIGQIRMDGASRVYVAALTGSFRVLNHKGELVANMAPGVAYFFEPQTPPPGGAAPAATGGTATSGGASGGAAGGAGHIHLRLRADGQLVELPPGKTTIARARCANHSFRMKK